MGRFKVHVNGSETDQVDVESIEWGYGKGRGCTLKFYGKHDIGVNFLTNNNEVIVIDSLQDDVCIFKGWLTTNTPGGLPQEGVSYQVQGLEEILNRYLIKFNGSIDRKYNVDNLPDFTSPNSLYGRWTVGQIMIDILEHALGIPEGGSSIPYHHPSVFSVWDPYIPPSVLKSYDPDAILSLALPLPEIRITSQKFWDYFQNLLQNMDNHGMYIDPSDPDNPTLVVHNYLASEPCSFYCGDGSSKWYETVPDTSTVPPMVSSHNLSFDISSCKTKIIIEGRGQLKELIPLSQGSAEPAYLVPHWQPGDGNDGKVWIIYDPQRYTPFWEGKISNGQKGPILVINGIPCHPDFARWDLDTGTVTTKVDLTGFTLEVWTLYLAPFQVTAGPGGTAWDNYSLISEYGIYDDSLIHESVPTSISYNQFGTYSGSLLSQCLYGNKQSTENGTYSMEGPPRDDTAFMQDLANSILARTGDEKVNGSVTLDTIDTVNYTLRHAGSFVNLAKWSSLGAQIMQITLNPLSDTMTLKITNDVFKLPSYAEFKRRYLLGYSINVLGRLVGQLRHAYLKGRQQSSRS